MADKKRYTIGMFVSGITDYFTANLCRGVMRGAEELDMNVVVFPGKYLYRDFSDCPEKRYEYQYSTVFSHVDKENIDGLIIAAGSIGCMTTEDKLMRFLEQYKEIPSVLVASNYEGYTCISYDNKNAVTEGMEYMISKAGCKCVCILDGPDGNTDVQERKGAYLEVLRKHNLPFRSTMRAQGDLADSLTSRQAAKSLILDNPRMDGLFCINDAMAYAAYDVMKEMGLRPGIDVKIMGYDNEQRSMATNPPLATVAADAVLLGNRAADALLKRIEGGEQGSLVLPSRFIVRESLGEPEHMTGHDTIGTRESLWEDFERIFEHYVHKNGIAKSQEAFHKFEALMEEVMSAIEGHLLLSLSKQKILSCLDELFKTEAVIHMDLEELMYYIDQQSKKALDNRIHDAEDELQLRELLTEIYKRLVLAVDKRYSLLEYEQEKKKDSIRDFVRSSMDFKGVSESSYAAVLNCMDWVDVKNACLYLYEKPIVHKDGDVFPVQEYYTVKAYCENGVSRPVPEEFLKLPKKLLFKNDAFGENRWFSVLLPLYFCEENYGFIFCDLSEGMFEEGEFATGQLGAAAHMLHLMNINEELSRKLESQPEE